MNSEEKFLQVWEKTRKKGKGRFIIELALRNSLLIVAASFFLRFVLFEVRNKDFTAFINENTDFLAIFFSVIFISSSVGAFIRWKNDEGRYNSIKNEHQE